MIKQDFTLKPFWRFSITATAFSLLAACGSQSVMDPSVTNANNSQPFENTAAHQESTQAYTLIEHSSDEPADDLYNFGLNPQTSTGRESSPDGKSLTGKKSLTDSKSEISVSSTTDQQIDNDQSQLEEDKEMTVLVLDDKTASALAAQQAMLNSPVADQSVTGPHNNMDDMISIEPPQPRILFYGFNQSDLSEEQQAEIKLHADFLAVHPAYSIQIHGHTDKQGHPVYNEKLATERAQRVAEALIAAGARPKQIETFAWGSRDPLLSAAQYDKNRRVEFIYLSDQVAFNSADDNGTDSETSNLTLIK